MILAFVMDRGCNASVIIDRLVIVGVEPYVSFRGSYKVYLAWYLHGLSWTCALSLCARWYRQAVLSSCKSCCRLISILKGCHDLQFCHMIGIVLCESMRGRELCVSSDRDV